MVSATTETIEPDGRLSDSDESVVVLLEERPTIQDAVPLAEAVVAMDELATACALFSPTPLLTKMLQIADRFRAGDSPREAMAMYFDLAEDHPGTPEAYDALERLLEIASNYEDSGDIRQARSLYERLL